MSNLNPAKAQVHDLIPMAHVADIKRSADFYATLGFTEQNLMSGQDGRPFFAALATPSGAELMLALASAPIVAGDQAILFYLYVDDGLAELRERLVGAGIDCGDIAHPFHMQEGEMRVIDPDGYVLLIGQAEGPRLRRRRLQAHQGAAA